MLRILFVIPYKAVEENVKQAFSEVQSLREEEITYDICLGETGKVMEIESDQTDVVIARGFTAASMRTSLPLIELQVSAFDMMKAVKECVQQYHCRKIAFIGTTNMIFGTDSINEVYDDAEIVSRNVREATELDQVMDELTACGVGAVIGGNSVAEYAGKKGIRYVLLQSGKESIYQAVEEALRRSVHRRGSRAELRHEQGQRQRRRHRSGPPRRRFRRPHHRHAAA